MQAVYRTIARPATNDLAVLILGESGTGKEVVAPAIHATGLRRAGPFVAINMAAIPRELIEAELFGHDTSAFKIGRPSAWERGLQHVSFSVGRVSCKQKM